MTTEDAPSSAGTTRRAPKRTAGAKPSASAATRTPNTTPTANAEAAAQAVKSTGSDVTQAIKDAAHAIVGFGLMGWNRAQVQRRALLKDLKSQRHQVESQLDGAKEQIATAIRTLDAKIEPVRHDIDSQLDKVAARLPEQVREVVASARKIARDTEHQVRQAVGAL